VTRERDLQSIRRSAIADCRRIALRNLYMYVGQGNWVKAPTISSEYLQRSRFSTPLERIGNARCEFRDGRRCRDEKSDRSDPREIKRIFQRRGYVRNVHAINDARAIPDDNSESIFVTR